VQTSRLKYAFVSFPALTVLPKVESVAHLQWLSDALAERTNNDGVPPLRIIAMIESAAAGT
jgi:citrate lyase beta subunit